MIPSTPAELRETLRGWPMADLRKAIRAGLPDLDDALVALIADWLARDDPEPGVPRPHAGPIAIGRALLGPLVPLRPDQRRHFGVHQRLGQHPHPFSHIPVLLFEQLANERRQIHPGFGHRHLPPCGVLFAREHSRNDARWPLAMAGKKGCGGRKPKLTPELQQRLTQLIGSGAFIEVAARYSGITDSTYHRWMARGVREPGSMYGEFCVAIERATAIAETRNVALIQRAAEGGNWTAAAWFLERKFPERWARRARVAGVAAAGSVRRVTFAGRHSPDHGGSVKPPARS